MRELLLAFLVLFQLSSALELPLCTGINIATQFQDNGNFVFNCSIDININLAKNYPDRNEIIFSNYTYWSYNNAVYQSNITSMCDMNGENCLSWNPSPKTTVVHDFFFQGWQFRYSAIIDSKWVPVTSNYLIDKNNIDLSYRYNKYYYYDCLKFSEAYGNRQICCNNDIKVSVPDTYTEQCLEYQTNATLSLKSNTLWNFTAIYYAVPNRLRIDNYQFQTFSDFNFTDFEINYQSFFNCATGGTDPGCYVNNFEDTLFLDFFLYTKSKGGNLITLISKLRVINGIPMRDNYELFTSQSPCWNAPTTFVNSSLTLDASLCCKNFGPAPPTTTTTTTPPTTTMSDNSTIYTAKTTQTTKSMTNVTTSKVGYNQTTVFGNTESPNRASMNFAFEIFVIFIAYFL